MSSYRYYSFYTGGQYADGYRRRAAGAKPGQAQSFAARPQKPSYLVAGLTTTIKSNLTNDFRFSYLRNFWQWGTAAGPPQLPGLGGALEIGGESANALIPYNVDSQDVRQRFWDGHDYQLNDNLSLLKGNHLIQFGGTYQRNFDYHGRNDNGVGIDTSPTYQIFGGTGISNSSYPVPAGLPASQLTNWTNLYNEVSRHRDSAAGDVLSHRVPTVPQPGRYSGLRPEHYSFVQRLLLRYLAHPAVAHCNVWRQLGLSMPPYEINGKQVQLVDDAGNPIGVKNFLQKKAAAALAGQTYNPTVGFETIRNVDSGQKYPFKPFYGASARASRLPGTRTSIAARSRSSSAITIP